MTTQPEPLDNGWSLNAANLTLLVFGNRHLRSAVVITVIGAFVVAARLPLGDLLRWLNRHPDQTRAGGWLVVAISALVLLTALRTAAHTVQTFGWHASLRYTRRAIGWWQHALSAGFVALMLLVAMPSGDMGVISVLSAVRAISIAVPLSAGLRFALLISPEDEPALEMQLAAPRPLWWLVAERAAITLVWHVIMGFAGTLAALAIDARPLDQVGQVMLVWLPATLLLAGIGLRVTLSTRQVVFGALAAFGSWVGFIMFEGVLSQYAYLWPLCPLLDADHPLLHTPTMLPQADYVLNRLLVSLAGGALFVLALRETRNEERMLTGHHTRTLSTRHSSIRRPIA